MIPRARAGDAEMKTTTKAGLRSITMMKIKRANGPKMGRRRNSRHECNSDDFLGLGLRARWSNEMITLSTVMVRKAMSKIRTMYRVLTMMFRGIFINHPFVITNTGYRLPLQWIPFTAKPAGGCRPPQLWISYKVDDLSLKDTFKEQSAAFTSF